MNKSIICGAVLMVGTMVAGGAVQASAANDAAQEAARANRPATESMSTNPNYVESDTMFKTAGLGSTEMENGYRLAKYDVITFHIMGLPQGLGYSNGGATGVSGASGVNGASSMSNLGANDFMIGPDGCTSIPYIGNVKLIGMTVDEVNDYVRNRLSDYIRDPQMTTAVKVYGGRKVYVMGEVGRPGVQSMKVDELNAYAAISAAGGVAKRGRSTRVQVLRVVDGTMYYKMLNMKDFVKKHDLSQNVLLQDGDIVYVPKSNGIVWTEDILPYVTAWALVHNLTD